MKSISNILGFNKEAMLLDSKLYIVKSMVAIATGYIIGSKMPIANLDMISVLLGVMYNLEPVNVSGIKGGINQLLASTLGAACTGILILLFGINVYTIALGMALTLYVSLKIVGIDMHSMDERGPRFLHPGGCGIWAEKITRSSAKRSWNGPFFIQIRCFAGP